MAPPEPRSPGKRPKSFADTLAARAVAVLCMLAALGALAYYHRDDLFPPEETAAGGGNAAYLRCLEDRYADIENMVEEGVVTEARAQQFRQRAEALCRAETEGASGGMPGLPPGGAPPSLPPLER